MAKNNNTKLLVGLAAAAVGYYLYKKGQAPAQPTLENEFKAGVTVARANYGTDDAVVDTSKYGTFG